MNAALPCNAMQIRDVQATLGDTQVLHGINLDLPVARWTSIVGPNGAGKSTLLKVLAGLLAHTGQVMLLDRPLGDWSPRARARHLSWLGQNEASVGDLTVFDVAMLGRLPHQAWLSPPGAQDHAAVERALRTTHVWDWRSRPLSQLSGGERQRVLLARALAVEADVLLMDEPLSNLDPPHQADWLEMAQTLVAQGKTVVSVLHEIGMALHADQMVVMADGRVMHQGACNAASTHRALERVFDQRIEVHALHGQWVAVPRNRAIPPGEKNVQIETPSSAASP